MPTWKILLAIMLCGAGIAMTESADADVISIPLVTVTVEFFGNRLSDLPGPYGEVTVNLIDPTEAIITFAGRTVGSNVYLIGGIEPVSVFPNAGLYSVTDIMSTNAGSGFLPQGPYFVQYFGLDGMNILNLAAFSPSTPDSDFLYSVDTISFTLHNLSAPEWSTASDVLRFGPIGPPLGWQVPRTEIIVTTSPANFANGRVLYGFVASPEGPTFVPNVGTLLLLCGGFVLLCSLRCRWSSDVV